MPIEILLIDDHKMFREGIRAMLAQQADMHVVGEASDGREAINLVRRLVPSVVIMDLTMPYLNGIDATRHLQIEFPGIKVIALTIHTERNLLRGMLEAGASGYLLKECAFEELTDAIHAVCEHDQVYLSPAISSCVLDEYLSPHNATEPSGSNLTPREREILQLVSEGNTNQEIAALLHISTRTVEKHRYRLMDKLQIHSLPGLVRYAIREGITKL